MQGVQPLERQPGQPHFSQGAMGHIQVKCAKPKDGYKLSPAVDRSQAELEPLSSGPFVERHRSAPSIDGIG